MALLLKNAMYIDWESCDLSVQNILVEEGKHGKINFISQAEAELLPGTTEVLNCSGKIVTKSFAIGHHHVYSALSRGMGAPKKNPENFNEILQYVWWTLDKCLDFKMIEYSALTTAIACAKAGTTFVIDHHASPFAIEGSLDIIASAFEKVGISHLLCYEISDRDGKEIANKGLAETKAYLQNNQGLVGLHASFTVGDTTLKKAVEIMEKFNSGIHIHVAEAQSDQDHCIKTYNKRVVERLYDSGALNSHKTILGHCLHLSNTEREIIKKTPCWIVQNMESNLNNNVGLFSGAGLGENVMLGTDGMHSDMLQSSKFAYFAGQQNDIINYSSVYQRFRNVHHYLRKNNFQGDGENNLVVIDYKSPTEINKNNFYGHFLYGFHASQVIHLISQGRLILKNREVQTVNEEEIIAKSRLLSIKLWDKMKS